MVRVFGFDGQGEEACAGLGFRSSAESKFTMACILMTCHIYQENTHYRIAIRESL